MVCFSADFRLLLQLVIFYATRCSLAFLSAYIETRFIATVSRVINRRCAWFLVLILLCNAGLWSASVALLPSSFTLYTTTLALSYAFEPAYSKSASPRNISLPSSIRSRTLKATCTFALGALLGWPFAIVLAGPFVLEEIFLSGANLIRKDTRLSLVLARIQKFITSTLIASLIALPIFLIDSIFYGRPVLVPLNIIVYNILSAKRGAGPELYGVEPPWFYLANLALNVGPVVLLLALSALPALLILRLLDGRRLSQGLITTSKDHPTTLTGSSNLTLLLMRTLPVYIWLGLLSTQPHKEERFMFPAYTALCFNAALTLEVGVGLAERAVFAIVRKAMSKQQQQKPTTLKTATSSSSPPPLHLQWLLTLPNLLSLSLLIPSALFSFLRIIGTLHAYHAPFTTLDHLTDHAALIRSTFLPDRQQPIFMEDLYKLDSSVASTANQQKINVCYGKEWYRFPNSFFLPHGFQGQFIKSEFSGILPKHFPQPPSENIDSSSNSFPRLIAISRTSEESFNDLNQEELDRYVDPTTECHLLVDSDPLVDEKHPSPPPPLPPKNEPYYARDESTWQTLTCHDFLDAEASKSVRGVNAITKTIARVLYIPNRDVFTRWRRFCLLGNKKLMGGGGQRPTVDLDDVDEEYDYTENPESKYIRESFRDVEL